MGPEPRGGAMYYVELAVAGLLAGAAYALSSLGVVVIYKGSGVLNFAQGAVGMMGTFVYANAVNAGEGIAVGLVLGLGTSALLGLIIYLLVMRPLRRAAPVVRMVASFSVLLLLEGLAELRWGTGSVAVSYLVPQHELRADGVTIGTADLLSIGIAILVTAGLSLAFARTTSGRATEAAASSEEGAMRLGYRVNVLAAGTWVVGSLLAGLAGILIAPQVGITATTLTLIVIGSLAAALVGGFKSLWITLIAAFVIGAAESMFTTLFPTQPGWSTAVPFFVIVAVMAVRGQAVPSRVEAVSQRLPLAAYPKFSPVGAVVAVVAFVLLPIVLDPYWQSQAVLGVATALVTLSVVLLTGYLGQISLMQWAAAGVGGFIGGALAATDHWPMIPAILVAAIVAFAIGAVIALPMLRIRGMDVAIVTLGAGIAIQSLLIGQFWGVSGLTVPAPDLFGSPLTSREFLYVAEVILAIVILALWFARRGVVGQKLLAIRGSERAAAACGIRLPPSKVITFGLASAIAAIGGSLFAFGSTTIETAGFDPVTSVEILAFCFINGVGSISGAVMVGFAIALGPIFLQNILHVQDTSWFIIVGGVATIWTLIRHPDGALVRDPDKPSPISLLVGAIGRFKSGGGSKRNETHDAADRLADQGLARMDVEA